MNNSNDNNTNADTALTPVAAPSVALSKGARMAKEDPAKLAAAIASRREALHALSTDPNMPADLRQVVLNLSELASPNRPGLEEMGGGWSVARMNIAQPTSTSEAKPEAAKNGDIYTTEGKILERPWGGIPFYFFEENINFPKGTRVPACQAPDALLGSPFGACANCPHLPFGKQNGGRGDQKQTDCHSNIVAIMLAADFSSVYKVQLGKTSRKAGAALLSLARQQQKGIWSQSYLLGTEKKTNEAGLYWIYTVQPTGKDNAPPVLQLCAALSALYGAERDLFLADWYSRPQRASQAIAEAEGEFKGGALDAGLAGDGVEPDLSTPPPAAPGQATQPAQTGKPAAASPSGKAARASGKPM